MICDPLYLVSFSVVPEIILKDDDCPLVFQCRWPDAERYRFELKKHSEGSVIVSMTILYFIA